MRFRARNATNRCQKCSTFSSSASSAKGKFRRSRVEGIAAKARTGMSCPAARSYGGITRHRGLRSIGKSSLTISRKPVGVGAAFSAIDCDWRTIWIADAHRGDGKRFIVRADETVTAFLKPNLLSRSGDLIVLHANFPPDAIVDKGARIFPSRAFAVRGGALLQLKDNVAVPPCV